MNNVSIATEQSTWVPKEFDEAQRGLPNKLFADYLKRDWNGIIYRTFPLSYNLFNGAGIVTAVPVEGWKEVFPLHIENPYVLSVHGDKNDAVILFSKNAIPEKRRVISIEGLLSQAKIILEYGNLYSPEMKDKIVESVFRVALAALHD